MKLHNFYPLDSKEWPFYHFLLQQKKIALFLTFSLHSLHFSILCLLLPTFLHILYHICHSLHAALPWISFLFTFYLLQFPELLCLFISRHPTLRLYLIFDSCQYGLAFSLKFQRSHVQVLMIYLTGLFVLSIRIIEYLKLEGTHKDQ